MIAPSPENREQTVPVDTFAPNHPWGLYNVHGIVRGVDAGLLDGSNGGKPGDGNARTSGDRTQRVLLRGFRTGKKGPGRQPIAGAS
jgi:formylglycine-generating enzyme required for sulfatase activity